MNDEAAPTGPLARQRLERQRAHRAAPALSVAIGMLLPAGGALADIGHHTGLPGFTAERSSAPDHLVKPSESVRIAFAQRGTFAYEYSLHPRDMRGTVVVTGVQPADSYGG